MGKAEILAELPKLSPQERSEILDCLWRLEEEDRTGPTENEKKILDQALADYEANPAAGAPWEEVRSRWLKAPS